MMVIGCCCFVFLVNVMVVINVFLEGLCCLFNKFMKCLKKDIKFILDLVGCEFKVSYLFY